MLQADEEVIILTVAGTIMLLLLGMFIISFMFFYQRKRIAHITEQEQLRSTFNREILTTRIEVHEQTLGYISQELHDNIGQVLSFVKLNLGTATHNADVQKQKKIDESRELLSQVITDLRDLSKSLSFQQISRHGLVRAIETEVERVNKSGLVQIEIAIEGEGYSLGEQRELVLFRIFQEALNNTLKYAHARLLRISLKYAKELFTLTIADDGIGFSADTAKNQNGAGLKNIESRAALIGATSSLESSAGKGCTVTVSLDPFKLLNIDATHRDSTG